MEQTAYQRFEDQNFQLRNQLDETLDAQLNLKKERQSLENLQERFYHVQQQELQLYQQSLNTADPEERVFFDDRLNEGQWLSRKAFQEFEEQQEDLEIEYKNLLEKEDSVRAAQRTLLQTEGKEHVHGT